MNFSCIKEKSKLPFQLFLSVFVIDIDWKLEKAPYLFTRASKIFIAKQGSRKTERVFTVPCQPTTSFQIDILSGKFKYIHLNKYVV